MLNNKTAEVQLTDNPLENIKIMAPLLEKKDQENLFIYVLGVYNGSVGSVTGAETEKVAV